MAWVRIHDGALGHPKIAGLVDLRNPFALWVWGLSHCQMHLTDGVIVKDAVPKTAMKAVAELMRRGLWELHDLGWQVHDYLMWNDCRERVLERRAAAEIEREATRERMKRWREAKRDKSVTLDVTPSQTRNGYVTATSLLRSDPTLPKPRESKEHSLSLARERETDELGDRARELLENYPVWYAQERHGARLPILGGNLQYLDALKICETWDSDAHVEKLARLVLTTDDPFIAGTDRGWKIFVLKSSWADDRLRQWEQATGVKVTG